MHIAALSSMSVGSSLLREVHLAEEDLAQVGMHNGLGCRGLTRPDLRRELGIVDRH